MTGALTEPDAVRLPLIFSFSDDSVDDEEPKLKDDETFRDKPNFDIKLFSILILGELRLFFSSPSRLAYFC